MNDRAPIDRERWAEAVRWLAYVDDDLRAIALMMAQAAPLVGPVAFHCQQAAEKMAKALLVAHGAVVPKIHDLRELAWRLREIEPEMTTLFDRIAHRAAWYINVRYPGGETDTIPGPEQLRAVEADLRVLRRLIDTLAPKA